MEIRPLTEAERKYTYTQSTQLSMQTGSIGVLHCGYASNQEFFAKFYDLNARWETGDFKENLDDMIAALCSDGTGFLQNIHTMREYVQQHPENAFLGKEGTEYGFRMDTERYAYMMRCNPQKRNDNVEIHCYVKKWLDGHIHNAEKGIRFIDPHYNELFRIADGGKIVIQDAFGKTEERACRYIDETHAEIGSQLYHICQFAELMERAGAVYTAKENKERICIGLVTNEDGYLEPFADLTVCIDAPTPNYCGYFDTNNLPGAEKERSR